MQYEVTHINENFFKKLRVHPLLYKGFVGYYAIPVGSPLMRSVLEGETLPKHNLPHSLVDYLMPGVLGPFHTAKAAREWADRFAWKLNHPEGGK